MEEVWRDYAWRLMGSYIYTLRGLNVLLGTFYKNFYAGNWGLMGYDIAIP